MRAVRAVAAVVAALSLAGLIVSPDALAYAAGERVGMGPVTPQAAAIGANVKGKPSTVTLFRFGWVDGKHRATKRTVARKYDVTGDGKADSVTVRVEPVKGRPGLAGKLLVDVGGRRAYTLDTGTVKNAFDQACVRILTLKNNKPFVFVSAYDESGAAHQALLAYKGRGFTTVVSNRLIAKQGVSGAHISSLDLSGNRVIVQFEFCSTVTGVSRTSFAYAYKGGTLKRESDTTRALRYATTGTGAFTKQPRTTTRTFAVYADAALTKRACTVKAGKTVRPVALRLAKNALLYQIEFGSSKGWVKCPTASSLKGGRLLSGTYGAAPLKASVPAYSSKKKLSAAALQRYGNHALYLARNEVYARHGRAFSAGELAGYFAKKSWYKPVSDASVKLNGIESANVALMLSIERHRNSPYVS